MVMVNYSLPWFHITQKNKVDINRTKISLTLCVKLTIRPKNKDFYFYDPLYVFIRFLRPENRFVCSGYMFECINNI